MNLPEKFLDNMKTLLGGEYEDYLQSYSRERVYGLRVNTGKIRPEEFRKISPFELKKVPWSTDGFYYNGSEKPAKHPYYFAGLYYLQEPSAMTPAEILPVEPGDRVLDTCAAPGGKSTELAAKLSGTGVLFSNDISNSRAQALLKNLELFGVPNAVILSEDPVKMAGRFENYFDKILIDAPCSGEGMFRKEPAVIKSWLEHGNEFYVKLQKNITEAAITMLRPGGKMVYSTCTFSPLEDEDIICHMKKICPELRILPVPERFEGFSPGRPDLSVLPDPELLNCIRIFPHKVDGEGHFVCLLQKGEDQEKIPKGKTSENRFPLLPEEARDFLRDCSYPFENGRFEIRNERLYFVPEEVGDLRGLRILRSGLFVGEFLKKRFEPSQAFAMVLSADTFGNTVSFAPEDPRTLKYLKGETVDASDLDPKDGWTLVMTAGYPLGFAKSSRGILKNKYLAGWRYQ